MEPEILSKKSCWQYASEKPGTKLAIPKVCLDFVKSR